MSNPLDQLDEYTFKRSEAGIELFEQEVDTPVEQENDTGYTTESKLITLYRVANSALKVREVSHNGWTVWEYENVSNGENITLHGKGMNAQEAHRLAQRRASQLVQ